MMRVWGGMVLALFGAAEGAAQPAQYDVVVYGATAGGTIAAIAAANEGQRVVLLEPGNHVGGMVTGGLSKTDHGNKAVVGGMSLEFYERLGRHYGEHVSWYPEPHVAEKVFRDWLEEAGVPVLFQHRVDKVEKEGSRITRIRMENGAVFEGRVFIDASYEGDLLPRAGIAYTWGREGQDVYGESLAGRIALSPEHQFLVPVSPYDDQGNLLPLIGGEDPSAPGSGDRKVQAYNFRVICTRKKDNQVPFPRPEGYDPQRYELLRRYLAAKPDVQLKEIWLIGDIQGEKADINNKGPVSTDHIGASWEYPEADYAKRAAIWEDHKRYVQGFFYFLANDPSVPEKLQAEVKEWGLAKDEFLDNDHWPHQLYIREARRMIGEYVMNQRDLQIEREKPDSIGMGSYNSDSHHVQRIVVADGEPWPGQGPFVLNEGDMQVPVRPYEISFRAILPKRAECENLIVPVCFSASHVAYSSMRMEPQYMIMGHAAGLAAAMAIRGDSAVQAIDVPKLRERLREQKQVLSLDDTSAGYLNPSKLPGVVVDNRDAQLSGQWQRSVSTTPFVDLDYAHSVEDADPATARFVPDLPAAGKYEVRFAYTAHPNRASSVAVTVNSAEGPVVKHLDERREPAEPPFVSLGTFSLPAGKDGWVEVSTEGADGFVVADAVQWLPAP
jgi:hypothetical protein